MEGMVKNLAKFGGDIIKFVGDAMIVMWPRKSKVMQLNNNQEGNKIDEDEKVLLIRKAI
jgi:class 3 adenylate cyclase